MKKDKKEQRLQVIVFWPPSVKNPGYKGPAEAVSSRNKVGKFDILPEHTNFITLISDKLTVHTPAKKEIDFTFKRGVLEVSNDQVRIFLGV